MKINPKKTIVLLALFAASFGIASCGSDIPEKVSTKNVTATVVDSGPSKEDVDKLNRQIWINKSNEKTWVDTTNRQIWVQRTNAKIAAQAAEKAAAERAVVRRSSPSGSSGGHGDGFLACVRAHESDTAGGYSAQNPSSSASGAYQILDSTWQNYKGYPTAASAPPHVQDERAQQLPKSAWNGSGC